MVQATDRPHPHLSVRLARNVFLTLLLAAGLGSMPADRLQAQTVTHVAGGGFHTLFSKSDGSLWVMGYNWFRSQPNKRAPADSLQRCWAGCRRI